MIKFKGNIVQFGFGAVGKSFYEKVSKEISFNENNYYVITNNKYEFEAFINLGGIAVNFIVSEITKDNFISIFKKYLNPGDLLIDFADTVGTKDILKWCAENNIMYINTGEADWPDNWYSIFNENIIKNNFKKLYANSSFNKHPIVLQHGNNPGLVSHFVKAGIDYIVNTQFKRNKNFKKLLKENKFNELAFLLGIKTIHVNDIDLQEANATYSKDKMFSTWCIDSFFFEMLSESTLNLGTQDKSNFKDNIKYADFEKGFIELKDIAANQECYTFYPNGKFKGFLVPHEETITIAQSLEVKDNNSTIYRPTVMFIYSPCNFAKKYMNDCKVNSYPTSDTSKPQDCENLNGTSIIRGHIYPKKSEILYKENISSGTEYVGVLIIGDNFNPVWIGNRIEPSFLYKDKKTSYWQTPTITPVAMSALSAICWMIKNKEKGGIYFPDDIAEYKEILKIAEKYISKTIYKTIDKSILEQSLNINISNLKAQDFFIAKEKE